MGVSESSETEVQQSTWFSPESVSKPQRKLRRVAIAAGSLICAGAAGAGLIALNDRSPEEAFSDKYVAGAGCLEGTPYDPMYNPEYSLVRKSGELILTVNPTIETFMTPDQPDVSFVIEENLLGSAHIAGIPEQYAAETKAALADWGC